MAIERKPSKVANPLGSDRAFGLVFTGVFVLVGALPALGGEAPRWWSLGLAILLLAVSLVAPGSLHRANLAWARLGNALHKVTSPLVLGSIYFLMVTPLGAIMRLLGKAPLQLAFEPRVDSYWIPRQPPGPSPESLERQF